MNIHGPRLDDCKDLGRDLDSCDIREPFKVIRKCGTCVHYIPMLRLHKLENVSIVKVSWYLYLKHLCDVLLDFVNHPFLKLGEVVPSVKVESNLFCLRFGNELCPGWDELIRFKRRQRMCELFGPHRVGMISRANWRYLPVVIVLDLLQILCLCELAQVSVI